MKKFKSKEYLGYKPIQGFFDLRKYKIPLTEFKKIWEIQKYLKKEQDKYFLLDKKDREINKDNWNRLKGLSAKYQEVLFNYKENNYKVEQILN